MSRARQLSSITALVRQAVGRDTCLASSRIPQLGTSAVGGGSWRLQVLPAWWRSAVLARALNTAASTIPDASAASLAAIEPPSQMSLAGPDFAIQEDSSRFRSDFAHFLRDASTSTQRAEDALKSMGKYLHTAKAEVDQHGRSSVLLDQHIIMNYVTCEDILISHYEKHDDKKPLQETLTRLSLLIQNMHILMVHTHAQKFEDCTHQLFKRYITACHITGSAQRARSAWSALLRTGNALLLQDVDMCMMYVDTLLMHSRHADDETSEEYFDDAIRELAKWQIRPVGTMGRPVTEGQTDGDVPRLFAPHRYGQVVGRAYREAVHAIVLNTWSPRAMQQLHTVLCSMRNVRTGLAAGERVPEYLALSNFHAHIVLSNIFKKQHEFESAPLEQLEDIIRFTLEDMEIHVGSQARQHDAGVLRACPQYIDEGLVQHLTFVCERIQNGSLALKALSLLSRTISRLPVPPTAERATTATGVRVPTTQTYLGAIHACCADTDDNQLLPALRLVGSVEAAYAGVDAADLGKVEALDPVKQLRALAERIGRSTDTWQKAWEGVEVLDKEGSLLQSHFNVLIAGLGQLPDGATFSPGSDESTDASAAPPRSLVQKAAELHSLLDKCFDGKVSVHTFNALLSVFCRPDGGPDSTQYIMNLLQLMDESSVAKTFETFELLIDHWARRRVYGALLATVEDMRAAGLRPRAPELIAAAQKAEAGQMHAEAQAIRGVLDDLGFNHSFNRPRYQRPIDERGRVLSE